MKAPAFALVIANVSFLLLLLACSQSDMQTTPLPAAEAEEGSGIASSPAQSIPDATVGQPPTLSDDRWMKRAPLLEATSEMSVAQLNGKIYVIGGYPFNRFSVTAVQVYDPGADRWSMAARLPIGLNHSTAAAVDGTVYVIGGQSTSRGSGPFLDTVFAYDPATEEWTPRSPMPTARSAGASAVVDGKIYVAGGRTPRGHDFAVYDTQQDTWTSLPDLPTNRDHIAAAAIDGQVYVVGGRGVGILEIYDPATAEWTTGSPMPTRRGGIIGIAANGCLHVFGGEGNTARRNGMFEEHQVYNPITDTWETLEPMPIPVHGVTGAAFIDGLIHLPGGATAQGGTSGTTIHQVFRAEGDRFQSGPVC